MMPHTGSNKQVTACACIALPHPPSFQKPSCRTRRPPAGVAAVIPMRVGSGASARPPVTAWACWRVGRGLPRISSPTPPPPSPPFPRGGCRRATAGRATRPRDGRTCSAQRCLDAVDTGGKAAASWWPQHQSELSSVLGWCGRQAAPRVDLQCTAKRPRRTTSGSLPVPFRAQGLLSQECDTPTTW